MSIKVENISHVYMPNSPFERQALSDVSLEIKKGEFVALIGHTGSGKSTLAEHLNGLLQPAKGQVLVDDIDLSGKGQEVKTAKMKVGMVFQYPEHQIFAETVYEDIAFGPRNAGKSEEVAKEAVKRAMKFVGLSYDEFSERSPFQLSGGQMRRVAIAGVIAMEPDYLILDEPSAGLDPKSRNAIFRELVNLYKERKLGVVLITHSMEEAAQYANRLLVMSKGKLVIDDNTQEVFRDKRDTLTEVGVDVPDAVKLSDDLIKAGLNLEEGYTKDELLRNILKAKGWTLC